MSASGANAGDFTDSPYFRTLALFPLLLIPHPLSFRTMPGRNAMHFIDLRCFPTL
jgi:hypothetical protein